MNLDGFNPDEHEPGATFEPLPKGWYTAMITESEEKETKAGDGTYLALTFEIEDAQYKGRKVWANLNLNNPNPKAVEIAQRNLADICRAVGVMAPKDSEELHYKPLGIYLVQKEFNGDTKNEVKGFRGLKGAPASPPPASGRGSSGAKDEKGGSEKKAPPWQRKAS